MAACLAVVVLRRVVGRRTLDATWLAFARVPLNALAFRVRRAIGWRRGLPVHTNEPKDHLFDYLEDRAELEAEERRLRERYDLEALAMRSSRAVYRDNVYVLSLLDRFVAAKLPEAARELRAIDVGSKDFRYAFALERFLATSRPEASIDLLGVEIDGHPVYADLHARADHADAYAAEVEASPRAGRAPSRVRYRVGDFLDVAERAHVVFFFFPFVLRYAIVQWGLPLGHFAPERLFRHAAQLLEPGGLLVVVNHTREELEAQRAILAAIDGLDVGASEDAKSRLVDYFEQLEGRAITVARKA